LIHGRDNQRFESRQLPLAGDERTEGTRMDNGHKSTLESTQNKGIRLLRPSPHDKHRLPDIDDLVARLQFAPGKGEVWFDDRRMVLLVKHFLNRYCAMHKRKVTGFTEAAIEALLLYSWPGNIRELENLIERGVILAPEDGGIDISHLFTSGENIRREPARTEIAARPPEQPADGPNLSALLREALASGALSLDSLEEDVIGQALHLAQGNVSGAAKILGTTRARVAYRLSGRKVAHPPGEKE
jgi:hypothetical protein